jgi:hypothetical protein
MDELRFLAPETFAVLERTPVKIAVGGHLPPILD